MDKMFHNTYSCYGRQNNFGGEQIQSENFIGQYRLVSEIISECFHADVSSPRSRFGVFITPRCNTFCRLTRQREKKTDKKK